MKCSLYALAGLLGLAACHSQTNQDAPADSATKTTPTSSISATPANSPGTSYQVFRALLPGQTDSITLHLVAAPRSFNDTEAAGRYGSYYGPDGHPFELTGDPSAAPDSVVLFDTSPEKAISPSGDDPYWRLRRQASGDLTGTINGQPARLRLQRPAAGALTFAVRYLADSAAAFPTEAKSPFGHISVQALVPAGGLPAAHEMLQTEMLRDLRGDSIDGIPTVALPLLYKQQRQAFFKTYREDAADSRPAPADTAGTSGYSGSLRYEDQAATYVLCQQGNLLSLSYFTYTFSGGAHGSYGTTGASYDLRTGRRLRYADIFLPTAQAQLPTLLGRAVRPLVGLQPTEPLSGQLFVKAMPITHNVFLTPGGVVFIYQPYEIASYAQGEVRVFLPLPELHGLLREGLPLPGTARVAAR